jgi:hypothetical protein
MKLVPKDDSYELYEFINPWKYINSFYNLSTIPREKFSFGQGYLRRLRNSAIFSLQQQFFATTISCNFDTHRDVLVFLYGVYPSFPFTIG